MLQFLKATILLLGLSCLAIFCFKPEHAPPKTLSPSRNTLFYAAAWNDQSAQFLGSGVINDGDTDIVRKFADYSHGDDVFMKPTPAVKPKKKGFPWTKIFVVIGLMDIVGLWLFRRENRKTANVSPIESAPSITELLEGIYPFMYGHDRWLAPLGMLTSMPTEGACGRCGMRMRQLFERVCLPETGELGWEHISTYCQGLGHQESPPAVLHGVFGNRIKGWDNLLDFMALTNECEERAMRSEVEFAEPPAPASATLPPKSRNDLDDLHQIVMEKETIGC